MSVGKGEPPKDKQFKKGNRGRPKGVKNKFTSLRDSFLSVYQEMGGDEWLMRWAKKNETEFFRMIRTMLPREINGNISGRVTILKPAAIDKPEGAGETD